MRMKSTDVVETELGKVIEGTVVAATRENMATGNVSITNCL